MTRLSFSLVDDEVLIYQVGKHPELYDMKNKDYRDKELKEMVWSEIGEVVKKTGDECKQRWNSIRSNYYKNKKRLDTNSTSQEGFVKWPHFKHLSFLKNIKHDEKPKNSNIAETIDESSNDSVQWVDLNVPPPVNLPASHSDVPESDSRTPKLDPVKNSKCSSSSALKKRPWARSDALDKSSEELLQIVKRSLLDQGDHVDNFMKSIAQTVKTLPPELISEAKIGILTLVTNLENKSRASSVSSIQLSD